MLILYAKVPFRRCVGKYWRFLRGGIEWCPAKKTLTEFAKIPDF